MSRIERREPGWRRDAKAKVVLRQTNSMDPMELGYTGIVQLHASRRPRGIVPDDLVRTDWST